MQGCTGTTDNGESREPAVECIVVWPHRSLGQWGALLLLGGLGMAFSAIVAWAAVVQAWPIVVYPVIAFGGFAWALASNYRAAHRAQIIELAADVIRVRQLGPASPTQATVEFSPAWVRVVEVAGPWDDTRLLLRQSGGSVAIGDCLSSAERTQLAAELRERIARRYIAQ